MAYTRTYRTIIPVEHGTDMDVLRWLTRESFHNAAGFDGLTISEYSEREVSWLDLPPKAAEHLPMTADMYQWFEFSATGGVAVETIEWLTAESAWRKQQVGDWLAAEREWRRTQPKDGG
ncbi:minor tail protein [Mycobacterium phage Marshawn]|uniref:Minor tail protein n=1 Tax=Mycobacterium phage Marshawn TaxID=2652423 RepID=A0A5P8D710_9CAUD|nr:minor tail protein [Mycobacterium phage Marshawn]QFP94813.1 minor tail protein [Mycobacterium phage Marshawn]